MINQALEKDAQEKRKKQEEERAKATAAKEAEAAKNAATKRKARKKKAQNDDDDAKSAKSKKSSSSSSSSSSRPASDKENEKTKTTNAAGKDDKPDDDDDEAHHQSPSLEVTPESVWGVKTHGCTLFAELLSDLASNSDNVKSHNAADVGEKTFFKTLGHAEPFTSFKSIIVQDEKDDIGGFGVGDEFFEYPPEGPCHCADAPVLSTFSSLQSRTTTMQDHSLCLDELKSVDNLTPNKAVKIDYKDGMTFGARLFHDHLQMQRWINYKTRNYFLQKHKDVLIEAMSETKTAGPYDKQIMTALCQMSYVEHKEDHSFCGFYDLMMGRVMYCSSGQRFFVGVSATFAVRSSENQFNEAPKTMGQLALWVMKMPSSLWFDGEPTKQCFFAMMCEGDVLVIPPGFIMFETGLGVKTSTMISWAFADPSSDNDHPWKCMYGDALDAIEPVLREEQPNQQKLQYQITCGQRLLKACLGQMSESVDHSHSDSRSHNNDFAAKAGFL